MEFKSDLKHLQDIQLHWIGTLDIQIETRIDQESTMITLTNYPKSRKLFTHKLGWCEDNTNEFKKIENEIIELTK